MELPFAFYIGSPERAATTIDYVTSAAQVLMDTTEPEPFMRVLITRTSEWEQEMVKQWSP